MKLYTKFVYSTLYLSTVFAQTCNFLLSNGCVSFAVSPGTGCAWMCSYCADKLGSNYYFTNNICKYESSGCIGNPIAGVTYTCCST